MNGFLPALSFALQQIWGWRRVNISNAIAIWLDKSELFIKFDTIFREINKKSCLLSGHAKYIPNCKRIKLVHLERYATISMVYYGSKVLKEIKGFKKHLCNHFFSLWSSSSTSPFKELMCHLPYILVSHFLLPCWDESMVEPHKDIEKCANPIEKCNSIAAYSQWYFTFGLCFSLAMINFLMQVGWKGSCTILR